MKRFLVLFVALIPALSAQAEKGPIWAMKLPVGQRSLLVPYAKKSLTRSAAQKREDEFHVDMLDRAIREKSATLGLLNLHPARRAPNVPFSFPFYNSSKGMQEIGDADFGYCLGFSYMLRRFNLLATFEPEAAKLTNPADYFPAVDAIADNRPATIPGFANLFAFASDPAIAKYIKTYIADTWGQLNVSPNGLHVYKDGLRSLHRSDVKKLVRDLRKILALGINPIVYFGLDSNSKNLLYAAITERVCSAQPSSCALVKSQIKKEVGNEALDKLISKTGMIHVVQVHSLMVDAKGLVHLQVWDINERAEMASTDLVIDPVHAKATFPLFADLRGIARIKVDGNIRAIALNPSEKTEIGSMLVNLTESCAVHGCAADPTPTIPAPTTP